MRRLPLVLLAGFCVSGLLATPVAAKERWTKVSTPYQTIFTDDSVNNAKEWAACLEAFHQDLQTLAPTDNRMLDPMTVVIFRSEKEFRAMAEPYKKKENGLMFLASNSSLRDGRFVVAVNSSEDEAARGSVFLQSTLWLTSSYHFPLPLWLVTGLQYIYSGYSVSGNRMEVGGPLDGAADSFRDGVHYPLEQMFGMTTMSPTYQSKDGKFNAQAWAFVHFMMFGENGANRPRLAAYMQALQKGEPDAKSLELLAPAGRADLASRFGKYVRAGMYRYEPLAADLGEIRRHVAVAPASPLEVNLALGYEALFFQGVLAASPYFDRAAALDPQAAATLEAQAELASLRNDELERNRLYAEAVKAGSTFYLARYYEYYPTIQGMAGSEAASDGTDPEEARKAFDGLKALLRSRPAFRAGHQTLALLAGSLHDVNPDDAQLLHEGTILFPRDPLMLMGVVANEIARKQFVYAKRDLDRLRDEEWENLRRWAPYANKLERRLESANNLYWLQKFYVDGDFAQADKLLSEPHRLSRLLPGERERVAAIRADMEAKEILASAREAFGRREWAGADALLSQVENMNPGDAVKSDAAKLRAELVAARRK
jgi:hypothetical protein